MSGRMLSTYELLHTAEGREWLRTWCERTVLIGDAKRWLALLERAKSSDANPATPDEA